MQFLKNHHQRGDTIVEVLICIAIVSFSLGIAYGMSRRNFLEVRSAEERSQSLKIAQQQIERIKEYVKINGDGNLTSGASKFRCIINVGGTLTIKDASVSTDPKDANCAVDPSGIFDWDNGSTNATELAAAPYRAGFWYDGNSTKNYYIYAGRDSAIKNTNAIGYNMVTLFYRIHP